MSDKLDFLRTVAPFDLLPDDVLARYHGVLGHYHIQTNKQDPGPALQWDKVVDGARTLLK